MSKRAVGGYGYEIGPEGYRLWFCHDPDEKLVFSHFQMGTDSNAVNVLHKAHIKTWQHMYWLGNLFEELDEALKGATSGNLPATLQLPKHEPAKTLETYNRTVRIQYCGGRLAIHTEYLPPRALFDLADQLKQLALRMTFHERRMQEQQQQQRERETQNQEDSQGPLDGCSV